MKTKLYLKNVFDFVKTPVSGVKTHRLCVSTRLLFLILALSSAPCALSQIPQGFNYQAIARDGTGAILQNTPLQAMLYVQSLSTGGTIFWKELHASITTNSFGLFNIVVGSGTRQTESTVATFNLIDWSVSPKYLKTEIYYGGSWKDMGTSPLMTVPYAMTSGDLAGSVDKLAVTGTTTALDEALFEVKNKNGQTIFAVYNEGVRIYVDDGAKGPKGGFAVGGFDMTKATKQEYLVVSDDSVRIYVDSNPLTKGKKTGFAVGGYDLTKTGTIQNYLDVSADSVRVYIDTNPATKKIKGGFAVGGYDMTKTGPEEYLRVTRDSTRIYVNDQPAKGLKGGFAVGGFDATKGNGVVTEFTSLNPDNYLIGHKSGLALTTGKYNSFLGFETGVENSTGGYNTILGYQAGYKNNADNNVFLGYKSGYNNSGGISNTFLGHLSGFLNSTGKNNVFLGDSSGYNNQIGIQNIFLGNGSGKANNADYNAFIGYQAGYKNVSGSYNSFIGYQAGYHNETGTHNAFIGYLSGWNTWKGSKNIFIGYKAGYFNYGIAAATGQPGNNNIYIGESAGTNNISGNANVYIGLEAGYGNSPDYIAPPRYNVYIGYQAGYREYKGAWNTFIGYQSGYNNSTGSWSTFIGYQAGYNHLTGNYNTIIGYQSGVAHTTGGNNTLIGNYAGYFNTTGVGNVFIGFQAGYKTRASNRLQIANSSADSLIYGEFDNKVVRINNKLGIGLTPSASTQALEVSGTGRFTSLGSTGNHVVYADGNGVLTNSSSDARLKEDIATIDNALDKVLSLRGVTFSWKDDPSDSKYIGFIAQEVEQVLPELVFTTTETGMKGVNYPEITAVLAESIKEQQVIIQKQQKQIDLLTGQNNEMLNRIAKLERTSLKGEKKQRNK